jgi:hypothetical protein
MEWNGIKIGQSKAIEVMIGTEYGYMGSSNTDAAVINSIVEHCTDVKQSFRETKLRRDGDDLDVALNTFLNGSTEDKGSLPQWMSRLEAYLISLNGGEGTYVVGDKLSLADIHIYFLFKYSLNGHADVVNTLLKKYTRIDAIIMAVEAAAEKYFKSDMYSQGEF